MIQSAIYNLHGLIEIKSTVYLQITRLHWPPFPDHLSQSTSQNLKEEEDLLLIIVLDIDCFHAVRPCWYNIQLDKRIDLGKLAQ